MAIASKRASRVRMAGAPVAALCAALASLAGFSRSQAEPGPEAAAPYYCEVDSDCAVKQFYDCCGYFPQCANRDHVPDIETIKKICDERGEASDCEPRLEIARCTCVEQMCASVHVDAASKEGDGDGDPSAGPAH